MSASLEDLTNTDVRWTGDYVGLSPVLSGDAGARAAELGQADIPDLLAALSDPGRFVVAHVILTRLSGVEYQAFPDWNGLAVELGADGTTRIDPGQRTELARRWEHWYQTEPRPGALPPAG